MTTKISKLPWSWESCAKGWNADPDGGEYNYWLEDNEIEGELPKELVGTLCLLYTSPSPRD